MTTFEKVIGSILGGANLILGIFVVYSTTQVGRLDTAFTQIGDMKGTMGKVEATVTHMQGDMAEMKIILRSIDGRLASAPIKPTQFFVSDPETLGKTIKDTNQGAKPTGGFWLAPANPSDADIYQKLLNPKR